MSKPKNSSDQDQPSIQFGGEWLPAHEVWKKMQTTTVVVDAIDRFNTRFPELASANTRDVVPLVRGRLKDIALRMPYKGGQQDIARHAAQLLDAMSPEDAIEALEEHHGTRLDIVQLVQLAGEKAYCEALIREAGEFQLNRISLDQTAQLWNQAGRPAPGGGLWSVKKVEALLNTAT
ncbi:MAG: hypothetical protein LJE59_06085 [Chromatiaceae bacterium]|jgi:hypothetical protein|nr:hypothetical protein [Chromatiaceae bacterium]